MQSQGVNEGVHMLDDFVCEVIHNPAFPRATPDQQGVNPDGQIAHDILVQPSVDADRATPRTDAPRDAG